MDKVSRLRQQMPIQQQGFTLIEVLVAMLITSFGLLGIAGLVVTSLRYNQTASQRSMATQLAADIMDRMRSNSFAVVDANGVLQTNYMKPIMTLSQPSPYCTGFNAASNPSCSPAQMADSDLYDWKTSLVNQLPGGQGVIQWAPGTPSGAAAGAVFRQIQVIVTWKEAGMGDKNWSTTMEAQSTNSQSTNNFNVCPSNGTGGLVIDSTVRCFQATFYP